MAKSKKLPNLPSSSNVCSKDLRYRYCNVVVSSSFPDYEEQVSKLIEIGKDWFDWYAYIYHKAEKYNDIRESSDHFHILYYSQSNLSCKTILNRFSGVCPANMVQFTGSGPGFAKYLTHKNRPEKIQYSDDDVVTSDRDYYFRLIKGVSKSDMIDMWHDYISLRNGSLTPDQFLEKYRQDILSMPTYQRFTMCQRIYDSSTYYFYHSAKIGSEGSMPTPSGKKVLNPPNIPILADIKNNNHKEKI